MIGNLVGKCSLRSTDQAWSRTWILRRVYNRVTNDAACQSLSQTHTAQSGSPFVECSNPPARTFRPRSWGFPSEDLDCVAPVITDPVLVSLCLRFPCSVLARNPRLNAPYRVQKLPCPPSRLLSAAPSGQRLRSFESALQVPSHPVSRGPRDPCPLDVAQATEKHNRPKSPGLEPRPRIHPDHLASTPYRPSHAYQSRVG